MINVARLPDDQRREFFRNTADKMGINPGKDLVKLSAYAEVFGNTNVFRSSLRGLF